MRRRSWLVFCGALLSGTLAGSLSFVYQQNAPTKQVVVRNVPTVDVALAAQDMTLGTVLADSNIRIVKWPRGELPEGATADVKKLIGRSVVMPIARGEPITPRRVADQAAGFGVLALIPNGMRAITLKLTETAATFINPGVSVDIIGSLPSGHTRVIMQNVRVLGVGNAISPPSQKAPNAKASSSNLITVLVTPAEAEHLALASQKATIQVALRNNMDDGLERTPGVRLGNLFSEKNDEPAPAPRVVARPTVAAPKPEPKPQAETVDLFRREKKSTVTIKPGS